ncbi:unnamed protein product [Rangifer tarandus platyrhynchus]|uniref:Uncharacterized protein n=1 Tax=Rangifer tarandus platyrhynchus TaxID=3082113 RepID=A0AC60A4M2_RANTA
MRLLVTCGECLCEACAATRPIVSVPRRVNGEASARRAIVGPGLAERRLRAGKGRTADSRCFEFSVPPPPAPLEREAPQNPLRVAQVPRSRAQRLTPAWGGQNPLGREPSASPRRAQSGRSGRPGGHYRGAEPSPARGAEVRRSAGGW